MSNFKRREIVDFIHRLRLGTTEPVEAIALIRKQFPGIVTEELKAAFAVYDDEEDARFAEQEAAYLQEKAFLTEGEKMFDGLPDNITFDEAVKIKAAQGNTWAIAYLASEDTQARRTYCALVDAAYATHPQFEQRGVIHWLCAGEGPTEAALIG